MSQSPQELIDRVSAITGSDLPTLAKRLGLEPRTIKRIRSGEFKLAEPVRLHLLDLERLYEHRAPSLGNTAPRKAKEKAAARTHEEPAEYNRQNDEALQLVLARVTKNATVNELAGLISEFAEDEDLPAGLRSRVVKILSEFIPQRMKSR